MADPKYANLPGIDTDSRDVYECGDLPEEDQNVTDDDVNTSVELVDSKVSFEKFSGKYVSGVGREFTARSTGYEAGGVGLAPPGDETVYQRLNRLKIEVGELNRDVAKIQSSKSNDVSVDAMRRQVDVLQSQLDAVDLNEVGSLNHDLDVTAIIAHLQSSSQSESSSPMTQQGTYQLYLKPEQEEKQNLRMAALEQRVARLEKALGPDTPHFSVLTSGGNLQDAVAIMGAKLSLLDPNQLPQVDSRLQAILSKVNDVNKVQKSAGQSEENKKVGEIFEMMQRWEGVRSALPQLVERLKKLDSLHAKSSDFTATLGHVEAIQTRIAAQLDATNSSHAKLSEMLKQNLGIVEANVVQLNKRISALTGR